MRERCLPVNIRNRQARCLRPKRKWWPESESNQRHADFQRTVDKKTFRNSSTYSTKDWVRHGCDKRQYFVLTPTIGVYRRSLEVVDPVFSKHTVGRPVAVDILRPDHSPIISRFVSACMPVWLIGTGVAKPASFVSGGAAYERFYERRKW